MNPYRIALDLTGIVCVACIVWVIGFWMMVVMPLEQTSNQKIENQLDKFQRQAICAKTKPQLTSIKDALSDWARSNCFRPDHMEAVKRLMAYIDGRMSALPD